YNYICFDRLKGIGSRDSVVVLDIGADNTDLIITDGTRIWQRNVPIGGNDFSSEVNRSIGFYSSINRSAKIRKVLGLGNGFKLPGLQKFLQQNLNQEI